MAWTSPRTWVAAETVTAALLNTHVRDNLKAIGDPWTSFTLNIVNLPLTSSTAKYVAQGKTVHCRITAVVSGAASGTLSVDLPVTANATGVGNFIESTIIATDISGSTYTAGVALLQSTSQIRINSITTSSQWNATVPFTWASTDTLTIAFTYEAA